MLLVVLELLLLLLLVLLFRYLLKRSYGKLSFHRVFRFKTVDL